MPNKHTVVTFHDFFASSMDSRIVNPAQNYENSFPDKYRRPFLHYAVVLKGFFFLFLLFPSPTLSLLSSLWLLLVNRPRFRRKRILRPSPPLFPPPFGNRLFVVIADRNFVWRTFFFRGKREISTNFLCNFFHEWKRKDVTIDKGFLGYAREWNCAI